MNRILTIAHNDIRLFLRDKSGYVWLFLVPFLFVLPKVFEPVLSIGRLVRAEEGVSPTTRRAQRGHPSGREFAAAMPTR